MTAARLALELEGWLELKLPERVLERVQPLLDAVETRPVGLKLRVEALVELGRHADALADLAQAAGLPHDEDWLDLREGWCRKRTGDLVGAAAAMERMIARKHRSAIAHYNLGCYLALGGQLERALDEVTVACGLNPEYRRSLLTEPDLDTLRGDPRFQALHPPGTD
jgi:tetratricopeptide (TPR) repeat protein